MEEEEDEEDSEMYSRFHEIFFSKKPKLDEKELKKLRLIIDIPVGEEQEEGGRGPRV